MTETVISQGIVIDGEISGTEPVVIEGQVKGRIGLDAPVHVAEGGVVEADVETTQLQVSGLVTGNIVAAERVEITSEGKIVGDIKSPRLLIADGAAFKGHIDMDMG